MIRPGAVPVVVPGRIRRETVTYVSNIYKYYVANRLVVEEQGAARQFPENWLIR